MKKKFAVTAPEKLEKEMLQKYPNFEQQLLQFLPLKDELNWPDWCYMPMAASYAIVTNGADVPIAMQYMSNVGMEDFRKLAAIVSWRLHKIIYRFDPDLAEELMHQTSSSDVPVSIVHHMPYPCFFIEGDLGIEDCEGFFAFLEWDERYPDATELRMHYLFKDGSLESIYFHWDDDLQGLFSKQAEDQARVMSKLHSLPKVRTTHMQEIVDNAKFHMNLVLYLCSDEPEVKETVPTPRRRGEYVPAASYPDIWEVGNYIGIVIRKQRASQDTRSRESTSTGGTKRPHMRRAHWHTYRYGSDRSTVRVKWLSPIFVHGNKIEEKPVVIHPVKE